MKNLIAWLISTLFIMVTGSSKGENIEKQSTAHIHNKHKLTELRKDWDYQKERPFTSISETAKN
ncbi:hypothetical protein [Sphingobacterium paucimobilis]|uniref:Uncharacterized protein n=1 Tax=Sphingobacterium paucimobilis HER1398 TaxID=1346330 RepID=U2HWX8_9SPHI|nr:hypothetical protein [Sphingobacterium paucimobilis]ERJ59780.1 hypothetical protein M472_13465 [Sphingobacterium paucimobilis HER1398]